jgi:hypothetical protein
LNWRFSVHLLLLRFGEAVYSWTVRGLDDRSSFSNVLFKAANSSSKPPAMHVEDQKSFCTCRPITITGPVNVLEIEVFLLSVCIGIKFNQSTCQRGQRKHGERISTWMICTKGFKEQDKNLQVGTAIHRRPSDEQRHSSGET